VYWGPGIRLSAGFFFGNFVWTRREVRVVDVRPYYYPRAVVIERHGVPGRPIVERRAPAPDVWRHDGYRRHSEPPRDVGRPSAVQRDVRPPEAPRTGPSPRSFDGRGFDDRGAGRSVAPGTEQRDLDRRDVDRRNFERRDFERRDFERREAVAAPPRGAAAASVPAPSAAPRPPEEARSGRNFDGRGSERRPDDGRSRQPSAQQAPIAPPRGAQQQPQAQPRQSDAHEVGPTRRQYRESRD
jgi:hypothetical protein